ncbi:MAG TPA: DUF2905 domain-containing protein [Bryobacteraceae bacterium]|nr:DUF2905 domain-containing protein [Bryobacteraceae bacterium]
MARSIVIIGLLITVLGLLMFLLERANIPLGRLPGDILWRGKNTTFYFPVTTSIIASLLLSFLFWLFGRR